VKEHADILDGIRQGRVFVTTGDLVSELYVTVSQESPHAAMGGELSFEGGQVIEVVVRLKDPDNENSAGRNPSVARVDLIVGELTGLGQNPDQDEHDSVQVVKRFTRDDWQEEHGYTVMRHSLRLDRPSYLRVRGTNIAKELEPKPDELGEDPWADLWFYSNPVFVRR
jgi:hypothetical protein